MEEPDVEKREAPHAGRQMESAGKVLTKDFFLVILRGKESQGSLSLVCCTYLIVFCRFPHPQRLKLEVCDNLVWTNTLSFSDSGSHFSNSHSISYFFIIILSVMMNCSQWSLRPASQLLWAHEPYSYRSAQSINIMFRLLQRSAMLRVLLCSSLPSPWDTTLKLLWLVALHCPVCVLGKGRVTHLSL